MLCYVRYGAFFCCRIYWNGANKVIRYTHKRHTKAPYHGVDGLILFFSSDDMWEKKQDKQDSINVKSNVL